MQLLDELQADAAEARIAAVIAATAGVMVQPPPSRGEVRRRLDEWLERPLRSVQAGPVDEREQLLLALGLR